MNVIRVRPFLADVQTAGRSLFALEQAAMITVSFSVHYQSAKTKSNDAIETLSSKQRAHLRSLAHHLKPVLHIGKDGINPATVAAALEAFNTRELMKIRVLESAPNETHDAAEQLASEVDGARVVQVIGRTAVLYRRDSEHPGIQLP